MTRDEDTLRHLAEQVVWLTDVRRTRTEREAYGAQARALAKGVLARLEARDG